MNQDKNVRELVLLYAEDELTGEQREYVKGLLVTDQSLADYYKELTELDGLLNQRPVADVSADWEHKIQTTLKDINAKETKTMKRSNLWKTTVGGGVAIAFIIGAVLSMQVYVKRGVQGRLKSAADDIGAEQRMKVAADDIGMQYEPYYLETSYLVKNENKKTPARSSQIMLAEGNVNSPSYPASLISGEVQTIGSVDVGQIDGFNTEEYTRINENAFKTVVDHPLSTFSIDVDTGSYSNVRRFLNQGTMPPVDAVRIEEMINYFSYAYPQPKGDDPFSINIDAGIAPWNGAHQLIRIGLQGKTLAQDEIPPSNLVFLIDVSGSMQSANKLPLLKQSLKMMVQQLSADQNVAIVVYAGAAGQVLESTPGSNKRKILEAIDRLKSGGSTAGGAGIKLAYKIAKANFIEGGNNRVILASDGDFNVGVSSTSEMTRLIEEKRKDGVFMTVLGFGMGNYKDGRMEQIANQGNGTYHYIDTDKEARKVLVEELGSTLFTIAKDVKLQIEFNPVRVKAYRLIGYENRLLNKEDFNDDQKDAGELGAGHTVTALYEIVPADSDEVHGSVDELKYQKRQAVDSSDLMTVKLRYKAPDADTSELIQQSVTEAEVEEQLEDDFEFVASVAEFGMLLRGSKFKAAASYEHVIQSATQSLGKDKSGYRAEFIDLVRKAQQLDQRVDQEMEQAPGEIRFKRNDSNE